MVGRTCAGAANPAWPVRPGAFAFSPDGRTLLADHDGEPVLWDVSDPSSPVRRGALSGVPDASPRPSRRPATSSSWVGRTARCRSGTWRPSGRLTQAVGRAGRAASGVRR